MLRAARFQRKLRYLSAASLSSSASPKVAHLHAHNGSSRDDGAHLAHPPLSLDLARRQAELERTIAKGLKKKRGRPSKKLDAKLDDAPISRDGEVKAKTVGVKESEEEGAVEDGVAKETAERKSTPKTKTTSKATPKGKAKATTATKAKAKPLSKSAASKEKTRSASTKVPARLLPCRDQKHHDLATYLSYANRNDLDEASHLYRGTRYEYIVAASLSRLAFTLHRTAGSNDLGIDFVGSWSLPDTAPPLKVLLQCKLSRPTPALVRELEGAFTGAPAGWTGEDALAVLVCTKPSTRGVRAAVQRSKRALVLMQITEDGCVKQVLWNVVAKEKGLEGLGVAVRYAVTNGGTAEGEAEDGEGGDGGGVRVGESIGLTWMGEMWRPGGRHGEAVGKADLSSAET